MVVKHYVMRHCLLQFELDLSELGVKTNAKTNFRNITLACNTINDYTMELP